MIAPPGTYQIAWQSPDGLMAVGQATLQGQGYAYINLGSRLLDLRDLQAVTPFLKAFPIELPLVLFSNCPGFTLSAEAEAQGLVFYAGEYRALQQQRKAQGGLIISYLEDIAVGGVYLMHGLSAQHRLACENTEFHDTIPSQPAIPLDEVLDKGLVDEILPVGHFENRLVQLLAPLSTSN